MKSSKKDWLIPVSLIGLSLVPALAGFARLAHLASGEPVTAQNARFAAAPLPIVLHVISAVVFSILGALQFSPQFRRSGWHRTAGKIIMPFAFMVAVSGLWMTVTYPWPAGDGELVYSERIIFGSAMLLSLVFSVDAIRRRDFTSHAAWMTRAYAIGLGAGTQVFTHLPWFLLVNGWPGETPRAIMMGAGWIINLAVAERTLRGRTRAANGARRPRAIAGSIGATSLDLRHGLKPR